MGVWLDGWVGEAEKQAGGGRNSRRPDDEPDTPVPVSALHKPPFFGPVRLSSFFMESNIEGQHQTGLWDVH